MDPRLSAIIELQRALSEQRSIDQEYDEIPKRHEEIQRSIHQLEEDALAVEQDLRQKDLERINVELDFKKGQEVRVRKESQLHTIKNDKEYKATIAEIENLDRKNTRLEEKLIELMDAIEKDHASLADKKREREEKIAEYDQEKIRLKEQEDGMAQRLEQAKAVVAEVVQLVQPELYRRFLLVFNSKRGQAIATANEGFCSACNMQLTPRIMQVVRRGQDIIQCEGCRRFLYWDHSSEEEQLGAL